MKTFECLMSKHNKTKQKLKLIARICQNTALPSGSWRVQAKCYNDALGIWSVKSLTASSCFFFWTSNSSIRLTLARSKFSWSGLRTSWKTCHLDPFWDWQTIRLSDSDQHKKTSLGFDSQDGRVLVFSPRTFVSVSGSVRLLETENIKYLGVF